MGETFEIIKAGAPDAPPEQTLYRIQQTYPDGSGGGWASRPVCREQIRATLLHILVSIQSSLSSSFS